MWRYTMEVALVYALLLTGTVSHYHLVSLLWCYSEFWDNNLAFECSGPTEMFCICCVNYLSHDSPALWIDPLLGNASTRYAPCTVSLLTYIVREKQALCQRTGEVFTCIMVYPAMVPGGSEEYICCGVLSMNMIHTIGAWIMVSICIFKHLIQRLSIELE